MTRIDSVQNPKIKETVKLRTSARARREEGLFFLEGLRLCMDVVRSDLKARWLFATDAAWEKYPEELAALSARCEETFAIGEAVSEKLSDTQHPQGVFCVLPSLDKQKQYNKIGNNIAMDKSGKYILLENVQDPKNLGAISRTAEALGISGLFVSGGCDITEPKALRSSMGALLRIPVFETGNVQATLLEAENSGIRTYASVPDRSARSVSEIDFSGGALCVIGNEAHGITVQTLASCQQCITIPMTGRAESLNAGAAASILMWEMVRPNDKQQR